MKVVNKRQKVQLIIALVNAFKAGLIIQDKLEGLITEIECDCFDEFTIRDLEEIVPQVCSFN